MILKILNEINTRLALLEKNSPPNKSIMEKVEEIEKSSANFKRCLDANICPKCGTLLSVHITDNENLPEEVFKCLACGFEHIRLWA
jgi:RNase P subunit RPR2